jgi:hypothetical protein
MNTPSTAEGWASTPAGLQAAPGCCLPSTHEAWTGNHALWRPTRLRVVHQLPALQLDPALGTGCAGALAAPAGSSHASQAAVSESPHTHTLAKSMLLICPPASTAVHPAFHPCPPAPHAGVAYACWAQRPRCCLHPPRQCTQRPAARNPPQSARMAILFSASTSWQFAKLLQQLQSQGF